MCLEKENKKAHISVCFFQTAYYGIVLVGVYVASDIVFVMFRIM